VARAPASSVPRAAVILAALGLAAVLVLAGVLVASSSDDGPFQGEPDVPSDYATHEDEVGGQRFSFAYPGSWGEPERGEEGGSVTLAAEGDASPEGTRPFLQARIRPDSDASFESLFEVAKQQTRLSAGLEARIQNEQEVEVEGADEARTVEYRFETETDSGREPARVLALFALTPGETFVTFAVGAPESTGFDPRPAFESFRFGD
jgi:hypothetical protein